jgi:hypothetical protein
MMKNLLFHTEKALRELTRPDGRQKKKKKSIAVGLSVRSARGVPQKEHAWQAVRIQGRAYLRGLLLVAVGTDVAS